MPDDHRPDPDDTADFDLPDQQALVDAFTAGLCPVKAKNEIVPLRCGPGAPGRAAPSLAQHRGAPARPVGRAASGRRATRGVRRRAGRLAGLLRPGRCARDCAARSGALPRHELGNTSKQWTQMSQSI
jgi:hypothetical protein